MGTTSNEPMRVRVTPEQFEAVQAINQRAGCESVRDVLAQLLLGCVAANGGNYDHVRHANGERVELVVIV